MAIEAYETNLLSDGELLLKKKKLRIVQLLLGHKKLENESTVRYLGIEVEDALEISESIEI